MNTDKTNHVLSVFICVHPWPMCFLVLPTITMSVHATRTYGPDSLFGGRRRNGRRCSGRLAAVARPRVQRGGARRRSAHVERQGSYRLEGAGAGERAFLAGDLGGSPLPDHGGAH